MLLTNTVFQAVPTYPRLTRVWIKTGDAQRPLKSVWIDETKLHETCRGGESEAAELAEDHLAMAA